MTPDPHGTVELLAKLLAGVPTLPGALCRDHPELFVSDEPDDQAAAIEICRQCPALQRCAAWAATTRRLRGIVGGQWRGRRTGSSKGNTT